MCVRVWHRPEVRASRYTSINEERVGHGVSRCAGARITPAAFIHAFFGHAPPRTPPAPERLGPTPRSDLMTCTTCTVQYATFVQQDQSGSRRAWDWRGVTDGQLPRAPHLAHSDTDHCTRRQPAHRLRPTSADAFAYGLWSLHTQHVDISVQNAERHSEPRRRDGRLSEKIQTREGARYISCLSSPQRRPPQPRTR